MAKGGGKKTAEEMNAERREAKARRRQGAKKKADTTAFSMLDFKKEKKEQFLQRRQQRNERRQQVEQRQKLLDRGVELLEQARQRGILMLQRTSKTFKDDCYAVVQAAIASKRSGNGRFTWEYTDAGFMIAKEKKAVVVQQTEVVVGVA